MKNFFLSCLIIFFNSLQFFVFSQEKDLYDSSGTMYREDYNSVVNDAESLLNAPLYFSTTEWLIAGGLLGITAGSFILDEDIKQSVLSHRNRKLDDIAEWGRHYGDARFIFLISLGTYFSGKFFNNSDIAETGRILIESLAFAGIITTALKVSTGRLRPSYGDDAFNFFNLSFDDKYLSFPSGHTTTAFALSSVLAARIKNPAASIALYGLAGLTFYQRVYSHRHWFSDAFLGAVIGTAVGNYIVYINEKHEAEDINSLLILPSINQDEFLVRVIYSF